jgi:hypothetical protein
MAGATNYRILIGVSAPHSRRHGQRFILRNLTAVADTAAESPRVMTMLLGAIAFGVAATGMFFCF